MEQFHVNSRKALTGDLLTGVVIALLSVPLSMGYAQVAGLPPQYGLYGSLIPVLAYALLTSSPRFVFGVDAAPAALVAALVPELGVAAGGEEAVSTVAAITLLTSFWLFLFWTVRGGRFAQFVSEPVLGGCVTGISSIVILSQVPKLFGGATTGGRAPALIAQILRELSGFHPLSFVLGFATIAAILIGRRYTKMSLSVVAMGIGIVLQTAFHLDRYGVALAGPVPTGLPLIRPFSFAHLVHHKEAIAVDTLAIALVIAAETLVATKDRGRKYREPIDNQRELLAYAVGNFTAALFGSSPVTGSLSRTNRANYLGVSSQWMSISAFVVTTLVLLFGAPLLSYLPVPVMTGIVISSLCTILEFSLAASFWKLDRPSFFIFAAAFGAEMLGLAEGVLVGVVLSFAAFTMRATAQPSYFLGCMEGHDGFFDLSQTPHARPIEQTVIYQFNGPLFFATIDGFEQDLRGALRDDTALVVVTGVSSVDLFAAERLEHFYKELRERDILFFLAGHAAAVNQQLIDYGAEELIQQGAVRQRLTQALIAGGMTPPYPLESGGQEHWSRGNAALENFSWAYGTQAGERLACLSCTLTENVLAGEELDFAHMSQAEQEIAGELWNSEDEKEYFSMLEMVLAAEDAEQRDSFHTMAREMLEHRVMLERQLYHSGHQALLERFLRFREQREAEFLERLPEAEALLEEQRARYQKALRKEDPVLAKLVAKAAWREGEESTR